MNEWEKAQKGYLYDANNDPVIVQKHLICLNLCFELNNLSPLEKEQRDKGMDISYRSPSVVMFVTVAVLWVPRISLTL